MNSIRLTIFSFLFLLAANLSFGYQLDMSVDEEIKKKYDSSKLNYEVLPSLPKVNSSSTSSNIKTPPNKSGE